MNIFLIVLFDAGFYCDIVTNIHDTLLEFIVIIIIITKTGTESLTFYNFFFYLIWFEIWMLKTMVTCANPKLEKIIITVSA